MAVPAEGERGGFSRQAEPSPAGGLTVLSSRDAMLASVRPGPFPVHGVHVGCMCNV